MLLKGTVTSGKNRARNNDGIIGYLSDQKCEIRQATSVFLE